MRKVWKLQHRIVLTQISMNTLASPTSKLPDVGTTIFTVMSALAAEQGALNLSQGFPDFDGPEALLAQVNAHMHNGENQYPPMAGAQPLRQAIASKVRDLYARICDAETEITVTAGATEALFCAIAAVVHSGDEVIVLDPAYDSYDPVIRLQGGTAVHVPLLAPNYRIDWERIEHAMSSRTRLLILNSPHNPTGMVMNDDDIAALSVLCAKYPIYLIGDEVYEHMVFDQAKHLSLCGYNNLYERSFVISSFGKTYHVTGWKVGYCVAPPALTVEFRRIHQYVTFTVNTPVQLGIADFLDQHPEHHLQLPAFYQAKRDLFCDLLQGSRFSIIPSQGTYFQLLGYETVTQEPDVSLARQWTCEHRIASIPISVFYQNPQECHHRALRFCFAKDDETLASAAEILCRL